MSEWEEALALNTGATKSSTHARVYATDIPGYVPPCQSDVNPTKMTKNQKYPVRMSMIPQGMVCTNDIVPYLTQMKYDDYDMLTSIEITKDPYVPMVVIRGDPVLRIP